AGRVGAVGNGQHQADAALQIVRRRRLGRGQRRRARADDGHAASAHRRHRGVRAGEGEGAAAVAARVRQVERGFAEGLGEVADPRQVRRRAADQHLQCDLRRGGVADVAGLVRGQRTSARGEHRHGAAADRAHRRRGAGEGDRIARGAAVGRDREAAARRVHRRRRIRGEVADRLRRGADGHVQRHLRGGAVVAVAGLIR
ncbi:hypothetical protein CATMIT_01934, partial [Catenibacterium mitsuokai DSM 15897]